MKKSLILTIIIILLIAGAAFAWWTISPLFIKTTLNEDIPVNAGILTEETTAPANPVDPVDNEEQPMTENEDNELLTTITGEFIDGEHNVSGTVKIVYSDGTKYLRFENFSTENGPDLRVYLAGDTTAKDFVDLGELPATDGNYNIQLPDSIDLTTHDTVLIWCRAFRVNFGSAELTEK